MVTPPFDRLVNRCEWQDDCLIWPGKRGGRYGQFQPGTRSTDPKAYVHTWIYENTVGPIPSGMELDHVAARGCMSTLCINPEHLEPVTHKTNMERARLTVCRAGLHDLTKPENVRWDENGNRRGCIVCHRARALARYYREAKK